MPAATAGGNSPALSLAGEGERVAPYRQSNLWRYYILINVGGRFLRRLVFPFRLEAAEETELSVRLTGMMVAFLLVGCASLRLMMVLPIKIRCLYFVVEDCD